MTSANERFKHYSRFSSPTPDSPAFENLKKRYEEKHLNDKEYQKKAKARYEQAISILNTQHQNGAGLLVDSEIRFFLTEFNNRNFQFGLGSMPSSFNVLEAFFNFNKKLFLFEFFDEEDYLFSFYDFIDFVTSNQCSKSVDYLKDSIEDDVIYSYNLINDPKDLSFKTENGLEYIFAGVSMIKRGNEISMFIVAGEKNDFEQTTKKLHSIEEYVAGKSYIKPAKELKREAVRLMDMPDFQKVFLYLRIDLDTKTIDTRYVQKDEGNSLSTITDDYFMFLNSIRNKKELEGYVTNSMEELKNYEAIFDVAYNCLYLPEYFTKNEEYIVVEEHPTQLAEVKPKATAFKRDKMFSLPHLHKSKDVWTLDKNIKKVAKNTFSHNELKLESTGYWKQLPIGNIGKDKKGNNIHSRTWVDQTLSWYEKANAEKSEVEVEIVTATNKSGSIYILRNASHPTNVFKIGLTTKTVEERASQLSGTPSVDKFLIAHSWFVKDCVIAEKIIHHELAEYRVNEKREFFTISFEQALKTISPIIEKINA
jgi:hypothetical protein